MYENDKRLSIWDLENQLKGELNSSMGEIKDSKYPIDYVSELVDWAIPIFHTDSLDIAKSNLWFAVEKAPWGKTPVEQINANIAEHLMEIAYEWAERLNIEL